MHSKTALIDGVWSTVGSTTSTGAASCTTRKSTPSCWHGIRRRIARCSNATSRNRNRSRSNGATPSIDLRVKETFSRLWQYCCSGITRVDVPRGSREIGQQRICEKECPATGGRHRAKFTGLDVCTGDVELPPDDLRSAWRALCGAEHSGRLGRGRGREQRSYSS